MAVLKRVKTQGSKLGLFDFSEYEFDPGFRGVVQRLVLIFQNAGIRLWNGIVFFFNSFLGLHYMYVVSWSLILSWILYPQKNMTYTDALFQGVSAATLTGLNTVNINNLKLYQQIFLFVVPVAVHPLTIASFMVLYRLHLYRKKFKHIEQTSKQQSKLRRAATSSQYDTARKQGTIGRDRDPQSVNLQLTSSVAPSMNTSMAPTYPTSASTDAKSGTSRPNIWQHSDKQQESSDQSTHSSDDIAIADDEEDEDQPEEHHVNKIKFGALPRPPSKGRPEYNPSEMFRSLQQMRAQNHIDDMDEEDGPALVIKSPRDIEADELRGIHSAVADNAAITRSNSMVGHHPVRRMSNNTDHINGFRPIRTLTRADSGISVASSRKPQQMRSNYLSWTPTVGGNSAFVGLTLDQIEELGGVEYRALKALRWFALGYFVVCIALGWLFIIPWVYERDYYKQLIYSYGVSPVTFGITVVLSSFNNSGLCALPSSIGDFWQTAYVPVVLSFLIMAGNVALPIFLRLAVWVVFNLSPRFGQTRETLGFLLDHPRRCFMLLFPSTTTWWLAITIVVFMVIEVSLFMILDSGSHTPHPDMSAGPRLLSAYFQSVSVRTVGFTIIDVSAQAPGMLVLNVIMIYVAIYPVAMSIRKSNVYEEQTLGRRQGGAPTKPTATGTFNSDSASDRGTTAAGTPFGSTNVATGSGTPSRKNSLRNRLSSLRKKEQDSSPGGDGDEDDDEDDDEYSDEEEEENPSTLVDHMRRQLSMDIWSFVVGLMLISISEGGSITRGKYTLFAVIYEVLSAHCTVGLSMGLNNTNLSTSAGFSNVGKLVLMAVMIRGRHRGMPYEVDRAILLNGRDLVKRDHNQANWVMNPRVMTYTEPQDSWLPRVATTASRLASFGTINRRMSMSQTRSNNDREPVEHV